MKNWQLDLNFIPTSAIKLLHNFKLVAVLSQHPICKGGINPPICVADINVLKCSDAGICKGCWKESFLQLTFSLLLSFIFLSLLKRHLQEVFVISRHLNFYPSQTRSSHCLKIHQGEIPVNLGKGILQTAAIYGGCINTFSHYASRQMPAGRALGFGGNFSTTLR